MEELTGTERLATATWGGDADQRFEKAEGSHIWLNGRSYLDFCTGPGVANIGHNHPEVIEAITRVYANKEAGFGGNMLVNKYQLALAEELCRITPGDFAKKVFFSNSGGEAVEAAILACLKKRPARRGMLSFIGGFHGRLGFCRSATTSKQTHIEGLHTGIQKTFYLVFPAVNPETPAKKEFLENVFTPEKYLNYVENTIGPFINEINFALLELVQGEGGINVGNVDMLRVLIKYLKDHDVWVIVDEVQSGLARTGRMWASDFYGVEPDILTMAKALSGGVVPIGATVMREDIAFSKEGQHSNTFGGNPPACAVGLKVLEIIRKEKLAEESYRKGEFLRDGLIAFLGERAQLDKSQSGVSGLGLMSRMTFAHREERDLIVTQALEQGLYLTGAGERSVRLMPPLTISFSEIQQAISILASVVLDPT